MRTFACHRLAGQQGCVQGGSESDPSSGRLTPAVPVCPDAPTWAHASSDRAFNVQSVVVKSLG